MIRTLSYVNSLGMSVEFGGDRPKRPWMFGDTDIFDIDLDYETVGGTIVSFSPGIRRMSLEVFMRSGTREERNRFVDVVSYDTRVGVPGTLLAGESSMRCYIQRAQMADWQYFDGMLFSELTVTSDRACWLRKHSMTLAKREGLEVGGLNYPYTYRHNYKYSTGTSVMLDNPFMLPAKCDIAFPGPCTDPYVIIAGNRYQVRTSAKKGQLVIVRGYPVDGARKQIVFRDVNGIERSILSDGVREPGAQIFAEVPVGQSLASWSGSYNVAIDLYEERLSPWWT